MPRFQPSLAERIAWYCLLAIPAMVPLAVSRIPFGPAKLFTFAGFLVPKLFVLAVLVSCALVAWSIGLLREEIQLRTVPAGWWLLGFLGLTGLSTIFALNPVSAFFGQLGLYAGLYTLLLGALAFFLTVQLVSNVGRVRLLARSTSIGGSIVATFGLIQFLGVDPFFTTPAMSWMISRGYSTIGNPDFTATYLVVPLVLSVSLALSEQERSWRVLAWSCAALVAGGLFVTLTRGAWIAALVGVVSVVIAARRAGAVSARALWALALGALFIVGVVAAVNVTEVSRRFTELASGWQTAGGSRLVIWRDAVATVARHPLLGVGPDSYRLGWYSVASTDYMSLRTNAVVADPHNVVLATAATVGVPATLVALGLVGSIMLSGFRAANASGANASGTDARPRIAIWGWWSAVLGLGVALLFSPVTIVAMTGLWLSLGVVASPSSRVLSVKRRGSYPLSIAGLIAATFFLVTSCMYLLSDYSLALARSDDPIVWARKAAAQAPWSYEARRQVADEASRRAVVAMRNSDPSSRRLFDAADTLTADLVAFNPYEVGSYYLRAKLLTEAGVYLDRSRLQQAVDVADAGLAIEPNSVPLQTQRAAALVELRR